MKPGPNYRMSRAAKTHLAVTWDRAWKQARRTAVIQAELFGLVSAKNKKARDA